MNNILSLLKYKKLITPIFIGVFAILYSCENDIKKVQELTAKQDSALISVTNIEMKYTVNGLSQMIMKAPLVNRFVEQNKNSYMEFPKGMFMCFYDSTGNVSSTIRSNYSIYYEDKGIWEARYDVEAVNDKGDKLNTEFLLWDRNKEELSSNQRVKMTTTDGIIYGQGFISNQSFDKWEVLNGTGIINIDKNE